MSVGRSCSRALMVVAALFVGAAASADWQLSSTDHRLLQLLNPAGGVPARFADEGIGGTDIVDMGARCTVIFNTGHLALDPSHMHAGGGQDSPETLRLPRGTLEMFIDHDTVAYRKSPASTMDADGNSKAGNAEPYAPAIQFHRLVPRNSEVETVPGMKPTTVSCGHGWSPDSIYDEDECPGDPEDDPVEKTVRSSEVNYLLRSSYAYMELRDTTDLVLPSTAPLGNEVTSIEGVQLDPADRVSSYWIDYDMDVWNLLRTSPGAVSLRVYFPGYIGNKERPMNPEHPHYVNWTLDMGMMEGGANEVFAKLEACADRLEIDGSWVPQKVESASLP